MTPALQAAIDEARRQAADAERDASARAAAAPADDAHAAAAAAAPAKQFAVHTRKRGRSLAQSLAPAALAPEHTPAARLAVFEAMAQEGVESVKDDTQLVRLARARLAFFEAQDAGDDGDDESEVASAAPARFSLRRLEADKRGRAAVAAAKGGVALSSVAAQSRS